MTLVSTVGGAAGPLYGTFFLEFGKAAGDRTSLSAEDWAAALSAATSGVQARGKAEAGDKTMVDALLPARDALAAAAGAGAPLGEALRAAADAAADGMRATIPLVARKGRASYLGERSAGHQDPGATSSWLLLETAAAVLGGAAAGEGRPGVAVVGLVLVSHSARLAEGAAELATQMAGPEVRIGAAGGLDEPAGALGNRRGQRVLAAIQDVWSDDGVLVLMDLGSAVRSPPSWPSTCSAKSGAAACCSPPLRWWRAPWPQPWPPASATRSRPWAAARDGLAAKRGHLEEPDACADDRPVAAWAAPAPGPRTVAPSPAAGSEGPPSTGHVTVCNRLGLHARPAALLVRTLAPLDARDASPSPRGAAGRRTRAASPPSAGSESAAASRCS